MNFLAPEAQHALVWACAVFETVHQFSSYILLLHTAIPRFSHCHNKAYRLRC